MQNKEDLSNEELAALSEQFPNRNQEMSLTLEKQDLDCGAAC